MPLNLPALRSNFPVKWMCFILCLLFIGCASAPQKIDKFARECGFTKLLIWGDGFEHIVFTRGKVETSPVVHVYIEGDGMPYIKGRYARDPTPREPLMLSLMAKDAEPSVYLGRPCYLGLSSKPECTNQFWTIHRYSEPVIDSMEAAINVLTTDNQKIHLIGHSGGGTLAVLLAERLTNVVQVTTLAANLDIQHWSEKHGYAPLYGSINPFEQAPLRESIRQTHIAGGKDTNVGHEAIQKYADSQIEAKYWLFQKQGHQCCWGDVWGSILQTLKSD